MLSNSDNLTIDYTETKELEILSEMAMTKKEIDWKPAVILSCAYIKKYGFFRISEFLKNRKTKIGKKLDNLTLTEVAVFLYAMHQINDKEFTQINQIQKAKNRIIHPKGTNKILYFGKKADNDYKNMVDIAIKLIHSLKSDY
ncbi:MAG: hypothetical protein P8X91_08655 [Candidatus Bathyarchaeota archaeon]